MICHGSAHISLPRQLRNWLAENKARYNQHLDVLYDAAMDNVVVTLAQSVYGKKRRVSYLLSKKPLGGYDHVFSADFSEFYKSWVKRLEHRGIMLFDFYGNACRDLHLLSYSCYNSNRGKAVQSRIKKLRTQLQTMLDEMQASATSYDSLPEAGPDELKQLADLVKMRWGDAAVGSTNDAAQLLQAEDRALTQYCMTACLDLWSHALHKVNKEFLRLTERMTLECIMPNEVDRISLPVDFKAISRGLFAKIQRAIDTYEKNYDTMSLDDMIRVVKTKAFIPVVATRHELYATAKRCVNRLIDTALLCHILDNGEQMGARTGNDLFAPSFKVISTRLKDTLATVRLDLDINARQLEATVDIISPHSLNNNEMHLVLHRVKRHLNRNKYNLRLLIDNWREINDPEKETLLRSPELLSARGAINDSY